MSKLAMEMMSRASFGDRLPLVWTRPFNCTGVGHDQRFVIRS
jgi:nucleoside-diphosphate-sugar epimerase